MMLEINEELQRILWRGNALSALKLDASLWEVNLPKQLFSRVWPPSIGYAEGTNRAVSVGSTRRGLHGPADT